MLGELQSRGIPARYVYLLEAKGTAADLVAGSARKAPSYTAQLSDDGLAKLASEVDGISVDRSRLLKVTGGAAVATDLVSRAHASGLTVFAWTLRPENRFLTPPFRRGSRAIEWGDWRGEFRMLLDSGLDGVFFDQPDLGVAVRDDR